MFNQSFDNNSSSHNSSQQSQTFLTVPRLIQHEPHTHSNSLNAYQSMVQKQVNFIDPSSLYKSEHKESLEEGELLNSRQSIEKRDFNANLIEEVEEQYKSLKLFQIEMQNIGGRKLMSKSSRKFSDSEFATPKQFSNNFSNSHHAQHKNPQIQSQFNIDEISPKFKETPLIESYSPRWPNTMVIVTKFISKLLRVHPQKLKQAHLEIIGDPSTIYNNYQDTLWKPEQVANHRYIIAILQLVFLMLVIGSIQHSQHIIFNCIFFSLCFIQIGINYCTGIYEGEIYITNINVLTKKYIVEDILITGAFISSLIVSDWFVLIFIIRLRQISDHIPDRFLVLYVILLTLHTATCITIGISNEQLDEQLSYNKRLASSDFDRYVISLQWVAYQLTNSGSSDLAYTTGNRILSIVLSILGIISFIGILKFTPKQKEYLPISKSLQQKIQRSKQSQHILPIALQNLRADLQLMVKEELFLPLLSELPFSAAFLKQLSLKVKSQVYEQGQVIAKEAEVIDRLYFLMEGSVYGQKGRRVINQNRFPNIYSYGGRVHQLSIVAKTQCQLAFIIMDDFYEEIRNFTQDFEKYCMLKDFDRHICECCGYRGHQVNNCQYVFYIPKRKALIQSYNQSTPNDRSNYYRDDNHKRHNALQNKNLVCITAISYAITNKIRSETELTNEIMGKLQGSTNNFEDSVLGDFQDSSRAAKTMNSPSSMGSQSLPPPMRDIREDRESSNNSRNKFQTLQKYDQTHSINSIKVSLAKSNISVQNDLQVKRSQAGKKATTSSSSINKKLQSTSILQIQQSKSQSQQHLSQQQVEENQIDLDRVHSYQLYFPSYNIENVAKSLNRRKLKLKYVI